MTRFKGNGLVAAEAVANSIALASREMTADEGAAPSGGNKLLVLNDGDGMRTLMNLFNDYVSEEEYGPFLEFAMEVDRLLYRHRGNRPLTREEKEMMEESSPSSKKKKKPTVKKTAPKPEGEVSTPPVEENLEISASDTTPPSTIAQYISAAMAR